MPAEVYEEVEVLVAESKGKATQFGEEGPLISLHALAGCDGPKTMQVTCIIGTRQLVILINSGSAHNFVDRKLAQDLQLAIILVEEFTVKVANGEKL
jgi:hypothetical protein